MAASGRSLVLTPYQPQPIWIRPMTQSVEELLAVNARSSMKVTPGRTQYENIKRNFKREKQGEWVNSIVLEKEKKNHTSSELLHFLKTKRI